MPQIKARNSAKNKGKGISGYFGTDQVARAQVLVANTGIFTHILKKVLTFLVTKSGYQQLKSGGQSKFKVAYCRATVNKFYGTRCRYDAYFVKSIDNTEPANLCICTSR